MYRPTKHKGGRYLGCKGIGTWDARGSVPGMQGDGFATEPDGIMEVDM
jgi:hypothetical protein